MRSDPLSFAVAAVPGVTLTRWTRAWQERSDIPLEVVRTTAAAQLDALIEGDADVCFVRLPIDTDGLNAIPLYEEVAVVVAPEDHVFASADTITLADLDGQNLLEGEWAATIELVATGAGVTVVPHSIARLHARGDVVAIPVSDAPATRVALVWKAEIADDDTRERIDEFIGIVRGRTANSSRATPTPPTEKPARAKKVPARQTTARAKRPLRPRRPRQGR